MGPKEIFKKYCRDQNLRFTPGRALIIDEIYRKKGHFDVDTLFLHLRNSHPDIRLARGSIYRNIPHLLKSGLIRISLADSGRISYEPNLGHQHHDHMRCLKCGRVFEFYKDSIDRAQKKMCENINFKMTGHIHLITGYCSKCRKKIDKVKV